MAKSKTIFVCQNCGHTYAKWQGKCDECEQWNTLAEELPKNNKISTNGHNLSDVSSLVVSVAETTRQNISFERRATGIEELDRCLGTDSHGQMGMVRGSVVLIGGEPGIGKSTLLTQAVLNACRQLGSDVSRTNHIIDKKSIKEHKNDETSSKNKLLQNLDDESEHKNIDQSDENNVVMYMCGEESPQQINLRIRRLLTKSEQIEQLPLQYIMSTNVDEVVQIVCEKKPKLLIIDSIQMLHTDDLTGTAGSLGQVKECTERITKIVKVSGIPTFLVGHVVKGGEIAGPKTLEHMVDAIFELTGERSDDLRFLRTLKNRFGATDEVGVFRMTEGGMQEVKNPSEYFLQTAQTQIPGSGVVCLLEGTRPILTEVQALVVPSQLAMPRRVGRGVDLSRVQVLAAVLQKHSNLPLGICDIFLSVVGGLSVRESGIDLGLAMALASSVAEKPLPVKSVFIGEVGLMGEIRPVASYDRRVKEVKRLGYEHIYSYQTHKRVQDLIGDLELKPDKRLYRTRQAENDGNKQSASF
ncbi:DNA repair protein RadA [bacterium]|nr:DNA repair protein RadA [bacterium]